MKPVSEWEEAELLQLVANGVPESLTLDYKASASLQNTNGCRSELSKDVSAFANSAGGRLVYGIIESAHSPQSLDSGVPESGVSREWIEQVINSNIHPRVQGVVIRPIQLSGGGTAFVIDVPQAVSLAPHQAIDKRYYKRFNFLSEPMADYEIRDVLRRAEKGQPDLWLEWKTTQNDAGQVESMTLSGYVGNLTDEPILYCRVVIAIEKVVLHNAVNFQHHGSREATASVGGRDNVGLLIIEQNMLPNSHMPLWRGTSWPLFRAELPVPNDGAYYFQLDASCPGAELRKGANVAISNGSVVKSDVDIFREPRPRI